MSYVLNQDLIEELVREFETSEEEIVEGWDSDYIEIEGSEYLIFSDEEADGAVKDYIKESLWAFNSSFLANITDLPEEVFQSLSEKCASGNEPILKLVEKTCGIDEVVDGAVLADGRGHYLSNYDGEETWVVTSEGAEYYLYRT